MFSSESRADRSATAFGPDLLASLVKRASSRAGSAVGLRGPDFDCVDDQPTAEPDRHPCGDRTIGFLVDPAVFGARHFILFGAGGEPVAEPIRKDASKERR
jgi:hypothetical protein